MSRALEKDVLDSLKQGDVQRAFSEISSLFDTRSSSGKLLEIELLGKSYPLTPDVICLVDDNAVGIPKVRLIQAFAVAYKLSKTYLLGNKTGPGRIDAEQVRRISAVLLLTDPEHLSAANSRKRAVLQGLREGTDTDTCLRDEKYFVDSLLTSRLHRHTKSPVLWSHRRWLLEQFQKLNYPMDIAADFREVILVSGERHPKNYYAWSHARVLLQMFHPGGEVLCQIASDVKQWCLKHHDDISGWSMLHFLHSSGEQELPRNGKSSSSSSPSVFRRILQMVESFRWRNESVWWFLHAMAATGLLSETDLSLFAETGRRMLGSLGPEEAPLVKKWFETFLEERGEGLLG